MIERTVTLRDIWQILWRRKIWLVLPIFVVTGVAFSGSYLLPVIYESSTKIIFSDKKLVNSEINRLMPGDVGDLPQGMRGLSRWLASTRSEIKSFNYLNQLVEELKVEPEDKLIKKAADMQAQFPNWSHAIIVRKLQIDLMRENIGIRMIGQNQIVITCASSNPKVANEMATKLASIYREKKLADEVEAVREGQSFTDQQLATSKREYDDAEIALANFKNSYLASKMESGVSSQNNLNQVESEIDATRLDLAESIDRRNFLLVQMIEQGVDTVAAAAEIYGLDIYVDDALSATREVGLLLNKYLWRDAKIQGQTQKVADALDDLLDASHVAAGTLYPNEPASTQDVIGEMIYRRYQSDFLSGKRSILGKAVDDFKKTIADSPYYEQSVERFQRLVDTRRSNYEKWLNQATGIQIQQATTAAESQTRYKILEPASIPLEPASPNRTKITIMGLALGILLGCCAVVFTEIMDHSIKSIEDAEEILGFEVIGTIPMIEK